MDILQDNTTSPSEFFWGSIFLFIWFEFRKINLINIRLRCNNWKLSNFPKTKRKVKNLKSSQILIQPNCISSAKKNIIQFGEELSNEKKFFCEGTFSIKKYLGLKFKISVEKPFSNFHAYLFHFSNHWEWESNPLVKNSVFFLDPFPF